MSEDILVEFYAQPCFTQKLLPAETVEQGEVLMERPGQRYDSYLKRWVSDNIMHPAARTGPFIMLPLYGPDEVMRYYEDCEQCMSLVCAGHLRKRK